VEGGGVVSAATGSPSDVEAVVVANDEIDLRVLRALLAGEGFTVRATTASEHALDEPCDLLVVDLGVGSDQLQTVLAEAAALGQAAPTVVGVADVDDDTGARLLSGPVDELIFKPLHIAEAGMRISQALGRQRRRRALSEQQGRLEERLRQAHETIETARGEALTHLAMLVAHRGDTLEHQQAVATTAVAIARTLGLPEHYLHMLGLAAPLHDLGKSAMPDALLFKPTALSEEEMAVMATHCAIGADILSTSNAPHMRLAQEIAIGHHERWDGSGYPHGQRGEQIPLGARVVALADAFDAMMRERPDRAPLDARTARSIVVAGAGTHFDPRVVAAFDAHTATLA
jgi:putative two-component system response regulator